MLLSSVGGFHSTSPTTFVFHNLISPAHQSRLFCCRICQAKNFVLHTSRRYLPVGENSLLQEREREGGGGGEGGGEVEVGEFVKELA